MYRAVFGPNRQEGVEAEMGKRASSDVEFVAAADSHTRYLVVGQEGRGKRRGLRPR